MGFTTKCFIRKNTSELQEKLKEMGYFICPCCNAKNAVWLDNNPHSSSIHGIGYSDETAPATVEEELARFHYETDAIDCGEKEELFLAIAALQDDFDIGQWFTDKEDWFQCPFLKIGMNYRDKPKVLFEKWHKATVEELIEHFK